MPKESWKQLEMIFQKAMDLEPEQRPAFLSKACKETPTLAEKAGSLLKAHDAAGEFLQDAVINLAAGLVDHGQKDLPGYIGSYKILDILGEGGMGTVYLAYQHQPVRRKVALKTIKNGLIGKEALARFQTEYQALARLNHANVAHVFDAGSTDMGPFFTMEYFPGMPISTFCRTQDLSISERLALMIQVCEGVQHAHQKGIIHRDLKPSNILVLLQNGKPVAKIIDFGAAKPTSGLHLSNLMLNTGYGTVVGTLAYISPEQTQGPGAEVDTRTDIYGLGAVLYELLTGFSPLDHKRLGRLSYDRALTIIREEEPLAASLRVLEKGAKDRKRGCPGPEWSKNLHGELDWVLARALHKSPAERYATTTELAADLECYLRCEPVSAVPPSQLYRMKKFIQRHRSGVLVSVLIILALTVSIATTVQSLSRTRQAKRVVEDAATEAKAQAHKYQTLYGFLTGMMTGPNPFVKDRDLKVVDVLADLEERIETEFEEQPETKSALYQMLADTYHGLGYPKKAEIYLTRALNLALSIDENQHQVTTALYELAELYYLEERPKESRAMLIRFNAMARDSLSPCLKLKAQRIATHLLRKQGKPVQAISAYGELLEKQVVVFGKNHIEVVDSLRGLALAYQDVEDFERALSTYEKVLGIHGERGQTDHPRVLHTLNNLALLQTSLGNYDMARMYHTSILEIRTRAFGPGHALTMNTIHNIGWLFYSEERFQEAEDHLDRAAEFFQNKYGDADPRTLQAKTNLGLTKMALGKNKDAAGLFKEMVRLWSAIQGERDPKTLIFGHNQGMALQAAGQNKKAEIVLRNILEKRIEVFGIDSPQAASTGHVLGQTYLALGNYQEAAQAFRTCFGFAYRNRKESERAAVYQGYLGYASTKLGNRDGIRDLRESYNALKTRNSKNLNEIRQLMDEIGIKAPE